MRHYCLSMVNRTSGAIDFTLISQEPVNNGRAPSEYSNHDIVLYEFDADVPRLIRASEIRENTEFRGGKVQTKPGYQRVIINDPGG